MATVLLVRHGETTWNRDRRVQGWAPTGLTERGHRQARRLAAHVASEHDVARVESSDLRRAVETARYLSRATDAPPTFDRGWRERDFGVYQGLTYAELFGGHPEFALSASGYAAAEVEPEGGESLLAARERVLAAFEGLLAELDDDETVAVVTHGGPLRLIVGELRGLDVVAAIAGVGVENCSVTEVAIDVEDGDPTLAAVGQVVPGIAETSGESVY